ncbi:MAG: hypothetical protein Q9178_004804 [Gyalolechia marmorata]
MAQASNQESRLPSMRGVDNAPPANKWRRLKRVFQEMSGKINGRWERFPGRVSHEYQALGSPVEGAEEASVNESSSQNSIPSIMPSSFFGLEICSPPANVCHGKEGTVPPQEGICPQNISSINNSPAFGLQWDPFSAGVRDNDEASVHTSWSQDDDPPSQNNSTTNLIPSTNNASGIARASKLSTKQEKIRVDTEVITKILVKDGLISEDRPDSQGGVASRGTSDWQSSWTPVSKRPRRSLYQKL